MRAYLAIRVPPLTRPAELPWIPEGHLTLRFLGEIDEAAVPAIAEAMGRAAAGRPSFDLGFAGMGEFVGPGRRVLWIGVAEGRRELEALRDDLVRELEGAGVPPDPRPFRPHVTLRRIRTAAEGRIADGLLRGPAGRPFGRTRVRSIDLWSRRAGPPGAPPARIASRGLPGAGPPTEEGREAAEAPGGDGAPPTRARSAAPSSYPSD